MLVNSKAILTCQIGIKKCVSDICMDEIPTDRGLGSSCKPQFAAKVANRCFPHPELLI